LEADVNGWATTRGALLRGTTVDAFGDEVDVNGEPVQFWDDFPLSIIETNRNVQDATTGMWSTQADLTARVPQRLPVQPGDRIRDNRADVIYEIADISSVARGIAGWSSRSIALQRADA
jgi:hypothetical protein